MVENLPLSAPSGKNAWAQNGSSILASRGSHGKGWACLHGKTNKNGNGRTDTVIKDLVHFQRDVTILE